MGELRARRESRLEAEGQRSDQHDEARCATGRPRGGRSKSPEGRSPQARIGHRASPGLARPRDTRRHLRRRTRSAHRTPTRDRCGKRPAAASRVLDTSGHPVAAGPHGFASVTSSRRENRSIAGPGSPVTKTCHASSHWRTNSSMSIALSVPRGPFPWHILAPARRRCLSEHPESVYARSLVHDRNRAGFADGRSPVRGRDRSTVLAPAQRTERAPDNAADDQTTAQHIGAYPTSLPRLPR